MWKSSQSTYRFDCLFDKVLLQCQIVSRVVCIDLFADSFHRNLLEICLSKNVLKQCLYVIITRTFWTVGSGSWLIWSGSSLLWRLLKWLIVFRLFRLVLGLLIFALVLLLFLARWRSGTLGSTFGIFLRRWLGCWLLLFLLLKKIEILTVF